MKFCFCDTLLIFLQIVPFQWLVDYYISDAVLLSLISYFAFLDHYWLIYYYWLILVIFQSLGLLRYVI